MTRPEPHTAGPGRAGLVGVARGGLANLAGAGVAGVAGLGVTWLAARGLGTAPAGAFFSAVAAFVLLSGAAKLGAPTGLVYWVARLRAQGRTDLVAACLRAGITPVAASAAVLAAGLWFAAPRLGGMIATGPDQAATVTAMLRALAPFLPLAALTDAFLAATRGYRLMRPTVTLDKLLRPGLQVLGLALLAVGAAVGIAVPAVLWPLAWAAPYLPVLWLAGYAMLATPPPDRRQPPPDRRQPLPDRHAAPYPAARRAPGIGAAYWRFTGPRAVASVLHLALQRVDILLVAVLAGPVPAALYTVAGRFVVLGQLANQALGHAVQPRLAERLGAGDVAGAGALYRAATGWLVLATWPLYLLVAVYAPVYLGLFGDPYPAAGTVVVVLAMAMLLATACGTVDMLLAMAGRTSWNLGNVALALAIMIGVDAVLIPRLGALGAAIGLAAAVTANNLLPLAQLAYTLRIHPFGAGTLTAAGLATGCFGVLPAASAATTGTGAAAVTATVAASTALYAAGARWLRRPLALDALTATMPYQRRRRSHAQ